MLGDVSVIARAFAPVSAGGVAHAVERNGIDLALDLCGVAP